MIALHFKRMVIQQKLLIMQLLLVSLAMLFVFVLTVVYQYMSYKQELMDSLNSQISVIEGNIGSAIAFDDKATATEILATLSLNPSIDQAYVTLQNGLKFSSYKDSNSQLPSSNTRLTHYAKQVGAVMNKPILVNGQKLGILHVEANFLAVNQRIKVFIFGLLGVVALAILLARIIAAKLNRVITEPIIYLEQLVTNITKKHNYTQRSTINSADEIGALSVGINNMLDNIKSRDDKLVEELKQRVVIEKRLDQLAYYDSVTDLPNRHAFTKNINQLLGLNQQDQSHFYLLMLDLDFFKAVNDTHGHEVGDELLKQCGLRLRRMLSEEDAVFRIGGDEFAIILKAVKTTRDIEKICQRIIGVVSQKFVIKLHEILIGTSIGVAQYLPGCCSESSLIKNADMAMYWAKSAGKNTYKFYSEEIEEVNFYRQKLAMDLQNALINNELVLHYQPIVEVTTENIIGFEALLRWAHSTEGYISPNVFIPIAEHSGLIVQIGDWVIESALKQLKIWQNAHEPALFVNINMSAKQFYDKRIVDSIKRAIQKNRIDPSTVNFELTESIMMEDVDKAITIMQLLKQMGTGIAVDDFGTGHSSMRYLKQFPIDTIKIDKCFVNGLPVDNVDTAIVEAIFALAESLKFDVVAEGVETLQQFEFLKNKPCAKVQGYYFSKPLPVGLIENLLNQNKVLQ
ncbi:MAG TPA: GGDEF domain-containing protein [Methylophilaceae bacterium]|nr:GGDEF domain-containing protein [Methylophilaceae bacterium]